MSNYTELRQKALQEIASAVSGKMHGGMDETLEVWSSRCSKSDTTVDVEQATYTDDEGNRWEVSFTIAITDLDIQREDDDEDHWGFDDDEEDA